MINAVLESSAGRILVSTDRSFGNTGHTANCVGAASISKADRRKTGRLNARKRFKLEGAALQPGHLALQRWRETL